jgi:hypothetical protein
LGWIGSPKRCNTASTTFSVSRDASSAELAIWTPSFEDRSAGRRVSQFLRQPQILRLADVAEFGPVLGVMLIELRLAPESRSAGKNE